MILITADLFSEKHILITADTARKQPVLAGIEYFTELIRPVAVYYIFKGLLSDIPQNIIGIICAKMHVAVVIDICLTPRDNAAVPYRRFRFGVVGMGFFRVQGRHGDYRVAVVFAVNLF